MNDKDTIITITIQPLAKGTRKVLVSGAPEGEMPVVRAGMFQELQHLIGGVWVELQKRKPQTVKVPAATKTATAKKPKEKDADADETENEAAEDSNAPATATEPDQLVAPAPPAALPTIEGDPTAPKETQLTLEDANG